MGINDLKSLLAQLADSPWATIALVVLAVIVTAVGWYFKAFLSEKGKQVANKEKSPKSGHDERKDQAPLNTDEAENTTPFLSELNQETKQSIEPPPVITVDRNTNILGGEDAIRPIAIDLLKRVKSGNRPFFTIENDLIIAFHSEISSLSALKQRTGEQNRCLAGRKKQLDYQIEQNAKFEKCIGLIITNPTIIDIKKFEPDFNVACAIEGIHAHLYKGTFIGYYDYYLSCELNTELLYEFQVTREQSLRMYQGYFPDGRSLKENELDEFPLSYLDGDILFRSALPQILMGIINDLSALKKNFQDMSKWHFRVNKP